MTNFSLSSHRRKIRLFLYAVLVCVVFISCVNIFVSVLLNKGLAEVSGRLAREQGISFRCGFSYFNLFRGLTLLGLEVGRGEEPFCAIGQVDLGFDLLSLLQRKVRIKNIGLKGPHVSLGRVSDIDSLLKELREQMGSAAGFFQTVNFKALDLRLDELIEGDIRGYFSAIKGDLWVSRGDISLKKIRVPAFSEADFFRGSSFTRPFDFVFEIEPEGDDLVISRLELSNSFLKFTGKGRLEDVQAAPWLAFDMDFMNILLDDFPVLNHEHMQARGVVEARLNVTGPLADLRSLLSVRISNAQFTLFDTLVLSKVEGSAVIAKDHLVGQDFSMQVDQMPFVSDFAVYQGEYPHVLFQLSSVSKVAEAPAFIMNLSADWADDQLVGDIKTRLRYLSPETVNVMDMDMQNFHLGYEEDLFINAQNLDVKLSVLPAAGPAGEKVASKDLGFQDLFGIFRKQEDGFSLDHLKGVCYAGTLEGGFNFIPLAGQMRVKGEVHLRDVDLNEFVKRTKDTPYFLLGRLDGDLRLDSGLKDMFQGQLFITRGTVEKSPLLDAVADFLGVASLKRLDFDELSMFFTGGRGEYTSQTKLQSSQVNGLLDGKITSYDKMDGYLSISIATDRLNESKQFKKILTYIRHGEPSVTFPFKISSYINSPRVLWLKNEFQEKLANLLPERNKRSLQRQVNRMVEGMKTE